MFLTILEQNYNNFEYKTSSYFFKTVDYICKQNIFYVD